MTAYCLANRINDNGFAGGIAVKSIEKATGQSLANTFLPASVIL